MAKPAEHQLSVESLIWAYTHGVYPMASSRRGRIGWYSPDPRAILPLDAFHVSHSLRRRCRKGEYVITRDQAFGEVIRRCAEPREYAAETWINEAIIETYEELHAMGLAHSVEAWLPGDAGDERGALVGGLYGVTLGGAYFGESMFSRATDASKVCLVHLVEHLKARGYVLLDVQTANDHTLQFGVVEIPRSEYLARLEQALTLPVMWE